MIERGKYIGKPVGEPPNDETDHFELPGCGRWVDCRDLADVFDQVGPLPQRIASQKELN
jgi:hypothetical protein